MRDLGREVARREARKGRDGEVLVAQSVSALRSDANGASDIDRMLTNGKIQNLRLAARHVDGAFLPAGKTFSFWKQVGRATRRRGFVHGREVRQGCVVPSVGGGLCQLSNALYDAALRAGCEIVERHGHTHVVPGSLAAVGRDATVFWNYVDLRFRATRDLRIEARLTRDTLVVRMWATSAVDAQRREAVNEEPAMPASAPSGARSAGDCGSCGVESCFRHVALHRSKAASERTAFLLDGVWPEFDAYLRSVAQPDDLMFVPLDGLRRRVGRYAWDTSHVRHVRETPFFTVLRSVRSRRLATHGAARQRALLASARRLAGSYAARLPYDATHLVVMQHLLPALWANGHLGGRTYDVLMTGLPMEDVHRSLDRALALHPESRTLGDFRADRAVVDAEAAALAGARLIVTPHRTVASRFGDRAMRLPWAVPQAVVLRASAADAPHRVVFPASTLARAGAYELREVARRIGLHVVLTGPDLERERFWDGLDVSRAVTFEDALRLGADAVVLPAFVEHQPRHLLRAIAAGAYVVASDACGIDPGPGISIVPSGDVRALEDALRGCARARKGSLGPGRKASCVSPTSADAVA